MIDPTFDGDRSRLALALDHNFQLHQTYRELRRETVLNCSGSTEVGAAMGIEQGVAGKKRVWGNLLQLAQQSHIITLAYNDPRFLIVPNTPEGDAIAPRLEAWLKRYTNLLNLGDIARAVAADSFAGWGIVKVARGLLPPGARAIAGQQLGPMCWRVSQDNFIFDGTATSWDYCSFIADMVTVPLKEAQNHESFLKFNPEATQNLQEFSMAAGNTDSRVHKNPMRAAMAVPMVRLVRVYLPYSNVVATWEANQDTFANVATKPLLIEDFVGHHTGPYGVLSHLDIPDNLIPVAQSESVKQLHFLYNDLAEITAEQSRKAKYNPVYEIGSQRDMEKLNNADDRAPVGVSNIQKIGGWEIPGANQAQTSVMLATAQLFKEYVGNLDDTLGLGQTAPTATQSAMIRQRTSARGAESRRRMDRLMELVARKLCHLALNDPTLAMAAFEPVRGTTLRVDKSWLPETELPRSKNADDFLITIIPDSMGYRDPETRVTQLNEAIGQIAQMGQLAMSGIPIELDKVVEIQAKYRDLPELREIYLGLLPEYGQQKQMASSAAMHDPSKPNGDYTRTNVSEQTNGGAIQQNLTQFSNNTSLAGSAAAPPQRGGMIRT